MDSLSIKIGMDKPAMRIKNEMAMDYIRVWSNLWSKMRGNKR